jgi:hypothetical protein
MEAAMIPSCGFAVAAAFTQHYDAGKRPNRGTRITTLIEWLSERVDAKNLALAPNRHDPAGANPVSLIHIGMQS